MGQQLREENIGTLASWSAIFAFPYIWGGMIMLVYWLYSTSFFGTGFGGGLVAAVLCLGLANPIVPGFVAFSGVRPLFRNVLGMEMVSAPGCVTGLIGFLLTALTVLFFVARDFGLAAVLFLAAPVVGLALAGLVTLFTGGGLPSLGRRKGSSRPGQAVRGRPALPGGTDRPGIRSSGQRPPSRLPPPRRTARGERAALPPRMESQDKPERPPRPRRR